MKALRAIKGLTYSDVENLVREATSNDPQSASDEIIWKIIHAASVGSNNYAAISDIMWRRIGDYRNPRHVYKGLTLLFHLLQHGENRSVFKMTAAARISEIERLKSYDRPGMIGSVVHDIRIAAKTIYDIVIHNKYPGKKKPAEEGESEKEGEKKAEASVEEDKKKEQLKEGESAEEKQQQHEQKHKHKGKHKTSRRSSRASSTVELPPGWERDPFADGAPPEFDATEEPADSGDKDPSSADFWATGDEEPPEFIPAPASQSGARGSFGFQRAPLSTGGGRNGGFADDLHFAEDAFRQSVTSGTAGVAPDGNLDWLEAAAPQRQGSVEDFDATLRSNFSVVGESSAKASEPRRSRTEDGIVSLLGDELGIHFGTLQNRGGEGAHDASTKFVPFSDSENPYKHMGRKEDGGSSTPPAADMPAQAKQPERRPERQQKQKSGTQSSQRPIPQLNPALQAELAAYARFINAHFHDDKDIGDLLPLDGFGRDLLPKLVDGIIVAKLINFVQPGTIDERALNQRPVDEVKRKENVRLVLNAAASLGVKTNKLTDLDASVVDPKRIALFLHQLIKLRLLGSISVKQHPELVAIASGEATEGAAAAQLLSTSPDNLLLKWLHYHLRKQGKDRRVIDLKDCECYALLLNSLTETMPDEMFAPQPLDLEALMGQPVLQRAQTVLNQANELGVGFTLTPEDIEQGNPRLNLFFTAALFNVSTGIREEDLGNRGIGIRTQIEKAGLLEDDASTSREERAFRMWINSLAMDDVHIHSVYTDLSDGIVLLKVLNYVEPGIVDPKRVEKPTDKFRRVNNCNYVVELSKKLGFSLVGISGADLVEGNRKLTLAVVWQLMRYHVLKFMSKVGEEKLGGVESSAAEKRIMDWANLRVQRVQGHPHACGHKLGSFSDSHLATSRFLLDLLFSVEPRVIDWNHVSAAESRQDKLSNASYTISVARKLGATIFVLPEDIVEVKPKMMLTFIASIMAVA